MDRKIHVPIPVQKALRKLGKDISDARRRRRIPDLHHYPVRPGAERFTPRDMVRFHLAGDRIHRVVADALDAHPPHTASAGPVA